MDDFGRNIILKQAQNLRQLILYNFPSTKGMCNFSSHILSEALLEFNPKVVFGSVWLPTGEEPHIWLEIGSNILDVTADQFNLGLPLSLQFPEIIYLPIEKLILFNKEEYASSLERRPLTFLEKKFYQELKNPTGKLLTGEANVICRI